MSFFEGGHAAVAAREIEGVLTGKLHPEPCGEGGQFLAALLRGHETEGHRNDGDYSEKHKKQYRETFH
jgi:hypothetical protein